MPKVKSVFAPTVADVLLERMKDKGLCLYHRWNGKSDKFELIDQQSNHIEWVHPDTAALLHTRLMYVGEYKTISGDVITVYQPKKGK